MARPYTEQALPGVEDISSDEEDIIVEWTSDEADESNEEEEEEEDSLLDKCLEGEKPSDPCVLHFTSCSSRKLSILSFVCVYKMFLTCDLQH